MAASVDTPSPAHLNKQSPSCPLLSPASDERLWSTLRSRVDVILENKQSKLQKAQDQPSLDTQLTEGEWVGGAKRMKEDSLLLLRGFDSIAHTLSQLSDNLENALQGARNLAEPPTFTEIFYSNLSKEKEEQEQEEDKEERRNGLKRKFNPNDSSSDKENGSDKENEQCPQDKKLKKAKNIAISMATKAASLARDLKSIKSDLCFMQERCSLLEEENRRARDGFSKGIRPEEDDLVRLQVEALLSEKSRLANENANLVRENRYLHQLVEYHQLTSLDLSASYEEVIGGMCLDFSSSTRSITEEVDEEASYEVAETPRARIFGFSTALDECLHEEHQEQR